MRSSKGRGGQ